MNDKQFELMRVAIYAAGLVLRYGRIVIFSQGVFAVGFLYYVGLNRLMTDEGNHVGAFIAALVVSFIYLGIYELVRCAPARKNEAEKVDGADMD